MAATAEKEENVMEWSVEAVVDFLKSKGMPEAYIHTIAENQIDGSTLQAVTMTDLRQMGLTLFGPNQKLLQLIASLYPDNKLKENGSANKASTSSPAPVAPTSGPKRTIHVRHSEVESESSDGEAPSDDEEDDVGIDAEQQQQQEQSYDVKRILKKSGKIGSRIVADYNNSNPKAVSTDDRILINRICVDSWINTIGYYPSSAQKIQMAKGIIAAFPELASSPDLPGEPYQAFRNPQNTGFLDQRLKQLRKSLDPKDRKRKNEKQNEGPRRTRTRKPKGADFSAEENATDAQPEDDQMRVDWMKNHPAVAENKAEIMEKFSSTFAYRQRQYLDKKELNQDPTALFALFPRMVDAEEGRLIFHDFMKMYPAAKDFERRFVMRYAEKIKALAETKDIELPVCSDECFQMCLLLCMPGFMNQHALTGRKTSFESRRAKFVRFCKESMDLKEELEKIEREKEKMKQPFLFVQGSQEEPVVYNLVIEDTIIPCGTNFTNAFKNLVASFFVLRLNFPRMLLHFYKFFSEAVFAVETATPSTIEFLRLLG